MDMHIDMHRAGNGRGLFARMMEALGWRSGAAPSEIPTDSEAPLEPLPTDALVRPSMHHRVTIQTHHEDWP